LHKIKHFRYIILKIKVETFNKRMRSRPVTQVAVGNVWATVTVEMVSGYCVLSYVSDKLCIASTISGILGY
jgi:molybdopterin-binding protein